MKTHKVAWKSRKTGLVAHSLPTTEATATAWVELAAQKSPNELFRVEKVQ